MNTAIFPGTFDPITKGHISLLERASCLCDHLVVAVAASARKQPYFSCQDRITMVELSLSGLSNITVISFSGLLIDFAKEHKADVIIRGLRAVSDFDYEFQMAGMNRSFNSAIETIFLPSVHEYAYISATMVREVMDVGRDPAMFLSPNVIEFLSNK
jgi:pantetheine-phosphate adenylyltransferase